MDDETTRLRALLERAEARVAELESIIAGRTTPPTRAELTAALATVTAERDVLRGDLGAAAILRGESPVTPATEALSAAERLLGRLAVDDVINDGDGDGGAPDCTGITAQWCPRCGDCACPLLHEGNVEGGRTLNDPKCPLHAPSSPHGDAPGGAT